MVVPMKTGEHHGAHEDQRAWRRQDVTRARAVPVSGWEEQRADTASGQHSTSTGPAGTRGPSAADGFGARQTPAAQRTGFLSVLPIVPAGAPRRFNVFSAARSLLGGPPKTLRSISRPTASHSQAARQTHRRFYPQQHRRARHC